LVKPYGKGSDPQCIKEANEDITALRWSIGSPRVMALTGLFFLVVFFLLLGLFWRGEKLRKYIEKDARAVR
jgi:hypothetical protein